VFLVDAALNTGDPQEFPFDVGGFKLGNGIDMLIVPDAANIVGTPEMVAVISRGSASASAWSAFAPNSTPAA
jgi:hypothetical protein